MANFITGIQIKGESESKKIHYAEVGETTSECGVSGPFEPVKITYQMRYEGRVCKKCFKSYVHSLSATPEEESEET
jgi:hypothetical protein